MLQATAQPVEANVFLLQTQPRADAVVAQVVVVVRVDINCVIRTPKTITMQRQLLIWLIMSAAIHSRLACPPSCSLQPLDCADEETPTCK